MGRQCVPSGLHLHVRAIVHACVDVFVHACMHEQKGGTVLQRKLSCGFKVYASDSSFLSSFSPSLKC